MPETPQQFYDRVSEAIASQEYRDSDWSQWGSWPFEGALSVRPLEPPVPDEPPRNGASGNDCHACRNDGSLLVWGDESFVLALPFGPSSLPFTAFLRPRRHADLPDLDEVEAVRVGALLVYLERAVCSVLDVPRVQVLRWGDGSEHLHWWVMGRPTGMLQLRGTFLSHWDDLLPAAPRENVRGDAELVALEFARTAGGEVFRATVGR